MSQAPEQTNAACATKLPLFSQESCHSNNVVGIRRMFESENETESKHGKIGCFAHQHILGNCSPDSMSTTRFPPMRVVITTMPDESGMTAPIIADSVPCTCARIANRTLSASSRDTNTSSLPSFATYKGSRPRISQAP